MNGAAQLGVLASLMVLIMSAGWFWQKRHANAGIVDVLWAAGVGLGALLCAATGSGATAPRVLLALLGGFWSARLSLHLWQRVRSEPEDGRYRHLRSHWNGSQWRFFAFFQFQAALVLLFALPFVAVAANPVAQWTPWLALALVIGVAALLGEAIADRQLARFRADPANRGLTCRAGLWRISRHPNYFFEWLYWFAYVALAQGAADAWLAWAGPIVMFVFLRWVSGIPFTEAQALRSRGEDYRRYQQETPMLFPWFPKSVPHTNPVTSGADRP